MDGLLSPIWVSSAFESISSGFFFFFFKCIKIVKYAQYVESIYFSKAWENHPGLEKIEILSNQMIYVIIQSTRKS